MPPTRPPKPGEDDPPPTSPPNPEEDEPPVMPLIWEFTRDLPTATATSVVEPPPKRILPAVMVSLPLSVDDVSEPGALLPKSPDAPEA